MEEQSREAADTYILSSRRHTSIGCHLLVSCLSVLKGKKCVIDKCTVETAEQLRFTTVKDNASDSSSGCCRRFSGQCVHCFICGDKLCAAHSLQHKRNILSAEIISV